MTKVKSEIPGPSPVAPPVRGTGERIESTNSSAWMRARSRNALALFHEAAKRIPAYKQYLREHRIVPENIKSWTDFETVPLMDKAHYLKKYPLSDLCWDGVLSRPAVFSATSGSTGTPFYFQRTSNLEEQYSTLIELFLKNGQIVPSQENPTLVIIGFGMGVWIGGVLTYRAFDIASRKSYPVSILPAGVNKAEILKALKDLAPSFKQTVLVGYPPFVKDIIDDAEAEQINLKKLHIRFLFAAESFSENFRDHLSSKVGIKNVCRDTLNIYGTADIGAMAFETPTSILVRRLALRYPKVFRDIFGETHKLPTLAQYNPAFVSFEAPKGEILLTGYSAIPLIRYAVGDHGGVHSFEEIEALLSAAGISLRKEARKHDIPVYELPFVHVYARVDLSTKLYGAIMFPEHVRDALEHGELQKKVTGKFTMQTLADDQHNQYLEIHIELKKNVRATDSLSREIQKQIVRELLEKNSEYHNNYTHLKDKVLPRITLWPHEDPLYFKSGIKQKWVQK